MKEFFAAHGIQASFIGALVLFNIVLTAISAFIDKLEDYFAPADKADPNSKAEKIKATISKILGWTSSIVDWLTGNKEH